MNGDAVVMRTCEAGGLFAVVDALGHGPIAAAVADTAARYLESVPFDREMQQILTGLHAALRASRGAAAMVCSIVGNKVYGCGVGNVEMRVTGGEVPVVLSPGVLGGTVRSFRHFHGKLHQRSRLVLFSDGVSARFQLDTLRHLGPRELSERLVTEHGRSHDDATALVVDYEG